MAITLDKVTIVGYTMLLDGNSGENQLTITLSSGQSGKTSLRLVYSEVNNGHVPKTKSRTFEMPRKERASYQSSIVACYVWLLVQIHLWFEWGDAADQHRVDTDMKKASRYLKKFLYL